MLIEDNISIIGNHIHSSPIWEIIIYYCLSNFKNCTSRAEPSLILKIAGTIISQIRQECV